MQKVCGLFGGIAPEAPAFNHTPLHYQNMCKNRRNFWGVLEGAIGRILSIIGSSLILIMLSLKNLRNKINRICIVEAIKCSIVNYTGTFHLHRQAMDGCIQKLIKGGSIQVISGVKDNKRWNALSTLTFPALIYCMGINICQLQNRHRCAIYYLYWRSV